MSITPEPVKGNVGPLALHVYGSDFLRAARALPPREGFSPVAYYLCCRSVELTLKAFLRTKGVPIAKLRSPRNFGHNLERLLDEATRLDLLSVVRLSKDHQAAIRLANKYYQSKLFEYLDDARGLFEALTGYGSRPDLDVLRSAAEILVADVEKPSRDAV